MRLLLLGPILLLTAGCASTVPVRPSPVPATRPAANFFCRYKLNPWYLPGGELRLAPGEAPFASFEQSGRAGVELTMPFGPASQGMHVVFTSGWVTFRAHYLPAKPFNVFTRAPLQFGSVLSFDPGAAVSWLGTDEAGRMLIEREPPHHYRPVAGSLRTSIACEDTTIGRVARDKASQSETGDTRWLLLAPDVDIPVSATAGGPAEGHLRYGKDDYGREVQVLEEAPEHVRIRKTLWPGIVSGWIPRAHTAAKNEEVADILGALGGLGYRIGEGRGTPDYPRCAEQVTLYLARDGALAVVGEIRKEAAVLAGERLPGWTTISLPELDWLRLAPGASWALLQEDVARCLPAPLPTSAPR